MEAAKTFWEFVLYVARNYLQDNCQQSAAALTYMSLFAIVPLMTVAYTMFSIVPAFEGVGDQIRDWIFDNFLPETGQEMEQYLVAFSAQARTLTAVGIAILAATAFLMLRNIDGTLNAIWRTRNTRRGVTSFLIYWAILSLGPILLGIGLLISTYLVSATLLLDEEGVVLSPLLQLVPFGLEVAMFTLLFAAVPNCKVPVRHALLGGFVCALAFELAKGGFTLIVTNTSYKLVYGAFAAVPLFLLWLYLGWLILLAGAELVHALETFPYRGGKRANRLVACIALLELFHRRHQLGQTLSEQDVTRGKLLPGGQRMANQLWLELRDFLLAQNLIRATENDRYILGRDLDRISLWDIAQLLETGIFAGQRPEAGDTAPAWYQRLDSILGRQQTFAREQGQVSLGQLFDDSQRTGKQ